MATNRNPSFYFSFLLFSLILLHSAMAITEPELDAAIAALRFRGYRLFGNSIAASDVRYDLLSLANSSSFTLFAPPDALLFSLDMASPSAAAYVASLRLHVAPGRFEFPDLRSLPDEFPLETLLPGREILVSRRRSPDADFLTVNGVDVVVPGIFYGQDIAVHGLGGILTLRRPQPPPPPSRSAEPQSNSPVSDLSPSRSADTPSYSADTGLPPSGPANPPVLESPMESPTTSPSKSADQPVIGVPAPSPTVSSLEVSPMEAFAMGFSRESWECVNEETNGCAAASGWFRRDIGGWPRDQEVRNDGAF